jgi:DNA-binding CsgD family transcriptional regulator
MIWSDEDYIACEQAVYEAAVVPEMWPDVLARLGTVSNSAGAALLCLNERGPHLSHAPAIERVATRFMSEGWISRNGRAASAAAKGLVGLPRFVNEDDYFSPGDAEADPMVRDLFRAEGFGWAAGFIVQLPYGDLVVMNVEQYYERGPIRGDDLRRLDSLYPHLARAAMLAGRADFERVRTAIDTLTAVGIPAAAITPSRKVVLANERFAKATNIWTTRGGDRLGLHDRTADTMLSASIAQLGSVGGPRSVPVRKEQDGAIVAVVQVVPIRRTAHDIFGNTAAIVVLSEPKVGIADATLLHSLFDLTPAELAVAQAVAAGSTVTQIALNTGRSVVTVRNQLKSAMSKTGSRRQVELVVLMQQLTGVVRH